jgi:hypothetical protein
VERVSNEPEGAWRPAGGIKAGGDLGGGAAMESRAIGGVRERAVEPSRQ